MTGWWRWTPARCWPPARRQSSRRGPAHATLEQAFIALLPEEARRGHQQLVIPPRASTRRRRRHRSAWPDPALRRFHRGRPCQLPIERGEIFGFLGSNGCGKTTTMKMLTGLLPADRRAGLAVRPGRRCRTTSRLAQARRLHVAGLLALHRTDGTAEPGSARPAVPPAGRRVPERVEELLERFGLTTIVTRCRTPAAGHTPAAVAGRGRHPRARPPDPRRADFGRRSGGPRRLLGDC